RAGLLLAHGDALALHVLPAHANDVAAPLAGVERKRQCEPRLAAERMTRLELRDLILAPSVVALAVAATIALDAQGRIAGDHADLDRVIEDHAQDFQQVVRRFGRVRLGADDAADVSALQVLKRPMAMLGAEAFEHVSAHSLRDGRERTKFR